MRRTDGRRSTRRRGGGRGEERKTLLAWAMRAGIGWGIENGDGSIWFCVAKKERKNSVKGFEPCTGYYLSILVFCSVSLLLPCIIPSSLREHFS
jgi:hypothetical protein